ncbi:MAG: phage major capsid protein [Fimbriimonadaceae bacterium]|nr:phage major capsid protein [Fimbriimonadaceae bacterium]
MNDLLRELRELKEQIRREHDPARLQEAIRQAVETVPSGPSRLGALEVSGAEGGAPSLKGLLQRPAGNDRERELQRLNDRLHLCGTLLRRDPRRLKGWADFQRLGGELRKALNTADHEEFVPDGFSVSLIEEVRLQRRLPVLFEQVLLPRSPLKWPVEGGIGLPFLVAENSGDTAAKVPTRNPATCDVTFQARTLGVRVPFSHEFDEDSIVAAEDYVRRQIAKALTDGLETAILNGDTSATHLDGTVTAANDARRVFRGLRKLATLPTPASQYDVTTGGNGFSQSDLVTVRRQMGVYGVDPRDLVLIVSVKTYYKIIGDSTNFGDFQTLDKVGPQAINVTGEVGALYGVPVVVSAAMPETCANAATDSGSGSDAVLVLANRRAYALATQVSPTIETVWDPEALQFKVVGFCRVDFQPWFDPTSERAVSVGYNIDVA